jgi:hypothetical protein
MFIVSRTIREAFASRDNADQLLADPAAAFRRNGLDIPADDEGRFNNYFNEVAGSVVTRLRGTPENRLSTAHQELLQESRFGCTVCRIAAYSAALLIVAVGVAGLAGLTEGAAAVIALANLLNVTRAFALNFIRGLGGAIAAGIASVTRSICQYTGAC